MRKKCKIGNVTQGFRLCMALILIQHDQKIRKPAKETFYVRILTVSRGFARLLA